MKMQGRVRLAFDGIEVEAMTQFVTPDLAMSRDEVEAIVRTYAPEGFAALGLDRLLTTALMVREFEAGNLEDE